MEVILACMHVHAHYTILNRGARRQIDRRTDYEIEISIISFGKRKKLFVHLCLHTDQ